MVRTKNKHSMKKLFTLFLLALLPMIAFADPVEVNGMYFNIISKGNVAEVTNNPNNYKGDVVIPEKVTIDGTEYTVTLIGQGAFNECRQMTSITIPKSITTIRSSAFSDCLSLKTVYISDLLAWCNIDFEKPESHPHGTLYLNGEVITDLVIPDGVTSIGKYTFSGGKQFTSITIPNSVTSIGERAFPGCGMTSLTIPNSVTSIGIEAFQACSNLTSVTLPEDLTAIGIMTFNLCTSLTSIIIPNSVVSVCGSAFAGCTNLTSVTIGKSVRSILYKAFGDCEKLEEVICLAENVPETRDGAFEGSYVDYATLRVHSGSVEAYKAAEPWNKFKEIIALTEEASDDETSDDEVITDGDVDVITLKESGKGTWCSDYDLDFTDVEGIKAYTATGYDDIKKTIWLTRVFSVPAGTGIMVKGDPGEHKIPHAIVKSVYANFFKGVTGSAATINETDGDNTNYYMAGGQFKKVNGSTTISPNRAYLQLPTLVFAGTR